MDKWYDINLSDMFFADLDLSEPHFYLGVGSGTHAEQVAGAMVAFVKVILRVGEQPKSS